MAFRVRTLWGVLQSRNIFAWSTLYQENIYTRHRATSPNFRTEYSDLHPNRRPWTCHFNAQRRYTTTEDQNKFQGNVLEPDFPCACSLEIYFKFFQHELLLKTTLKTSKWDTVRKVKQSVQGVVRPHLSSSGW